MNDLLYQKLNEDDQSLLLQGSLNKLNNKSQETSIFSSYVNLTNSVIGSGILGLPFAFAAYGWVLGFFTIFVSAIATCFSLHLLALCSTRVEPPASFYRVTEATMPRFSFLIDISVVILCFGFGISYLIVMGDLMPDVMSNFGASEFWQHREIWVVIGFCVVFPLSCLKTLDALQWTSSLVVLFVLFIAGLSLAFALDDNLHACGDDDDGDDRACAGDTAMVTIKMDTLRSFGVFIFAYSCQMNIFPVVNELRNPSIQRFDLVINLSIASAFAMYCIGAGAGYAAYGDKVDANLLVSFPETTLVSVARLLVCLMVAFSYPLQCNPARNSILSLWEMIMGGPNVEEVERSVSRSISRSKDASVAQEPLTKEDWVMHVRFVVATCIFLFGSFGIAMVISNLGVVLSLIGATGSTVITFILPGAAYCIMFENDGPLWKWYGAACMFGLGVIIMPVCVVCIFI